MPRINVKDKRKHQLMEANMASIARRGLVDTTIAHVSKGAGMSRGIVNFYFTSKEKMMHETLTFLADEYTAAWEEVAEKGHQAKQTALTLVETIHQALTSDKLCTAKRLAVWASFFGHAGTHAPYAKIIHAMDEKLSTKLKELWRQAGYEPKIAAQRAGQMLAAIRGHWLQTALGSDIHRPSTYHLAWATIWNNGAACEVAKPAKVKSADVSVKGKKIPAVLPGQLDFGDLFSKG